MLSCPFVCTVLALSLQCQLAKALVCGDGECFNCQFCDGDCMNCRCDNVMACCCGAPPGHYATGDYKIPCPGGTYQDTGGSHYCKACNVTNPEMKYNLTMRGAITLEDCEEQVCADQDWGAEMMCETGQNVVKYMQYQDRNSTFCDMLDIPFLECFWKMSRDASLSTSVSFFTFVSALCVFD